MKEAFLRNMNWAEKIGRPIHSFGSEYCLFLMIGGIVGLFLMANVQQPTLLYKIIFILSALAVSSPVILIAIILLVYLFACVRALVEGLFGSSHRPIE